MKTKLSRLLFVCFISAGHYAYAANIDEHVEYEHSLSLYGWIPNLDTKFKYNLPRNDDSSNNGESEKANSDNSEKLDMVFMGGYGFRKGKYSFLGDFVYLRTSNHHKVTVLKQDIKSKHELKAWMLGLYAGYNVIDSENFRVDAIGGMRYFSLGLDASIDILGFSPAISPSTDLTDGVIGARGFINMQDNWFVPYHFDIGSGNSCLTWQAYTGLGYRFDWGEVVLSYRAIHYSTDDSKLIKEFSLKGPQLGAIFKF